MILFLTHADTEILGLRVVSEGLPDGFPPLCAANPATIDAVPALDDAETVIVRLLGGRRSWAPLDQLAKECRERSIPLLCFGGEAVPDAEMMALSTVPGGVVTQCLEYLVQGGTANLEQLVRFVADTVLRHGFGFEPPVTLPAAGVFGTPAIEAGQPTIGVIFYRAHVLTGNTTFVTDLCDAITSMGCNALPIFCYSLREGREVTALLAQHRATAVISTVLAAGSFAPGATVGTSRSTTAHDNNAEEGWDEHTLADLGVPILQGIVSTASSAEWKASPAGLAPLDVAWQVALPELDGRIIGVPFSFKEIVDDGDALGAPVAAYRTVADRVDRVAGLACRLGRLSQQPAAERKIAIVLSAYPTRRSRLGNAVGLDTAASLIELLAALHEGGYRVERTFDSGDALMAELADGLAYESATLDGAQLGRLAGTLSAADYRRWFEQLPAGVGAEIVERWGEAPGEVHLTPSGDLAFAGIDLGGVLVAVQPPRGFGENPVAVYHSPVLPPTHHYVAFYRWLESSFGAAAVIHLGKHGTLEWLPGKGVGLSGRCAPDLALGDLPFVYPFVVNDPGEGAQAKRRAHAVVVDHLVPPLTRADAYDDIARLEHLLDQHAQLAALDPAKLPAIRRQVWDLLVEAEIHRDLALESRYGPGGPPGDATSFDDLVLEVDGYLCELKDAQIRGGLHVLGRPPAGDALVDLVLALTRLKQGSVPSLRAGVADAIGVDLDNAGHAGLDRVEAACRALVEDLAANHWQLPAEILLLPPEEAILAREGRPVPDEEPPLSAASANLPGKGALLPLDVVTTLSWICSGLVPALFATTGEVTSVLGALRGGFVRPGPSGAPSRGMAHVLPTGRNFYSLDPKAVPSPLAMEVGSALAEKLCQRHLAEEGRYPRSVAIVVWGTAVMRTGGDDVAEMLALLGARPRWSAESGRVEGLEVVPLHELGRPRVDVTLRVSGFFRDAFPHVIALADEAVELIAALDESPDDNPLRLSAPGEPRIFGPAPGSYGSGILPVIETRNWQTDDDLAAIYLAWSGWSYGRRAMGVAAGEALAKRLEATEVAVKNQDNREHDIFDSDDYLQDHGGLVAAVRSLRGGVAPKAVFGDSSDPSRARVRSLAEEAARVVRTRVLNPKWLSAMQRHGYKGAFEMAATVDYLFGYDATAHVVEDWMYERVTAAYVADPSMRKFFERSNPWALRSVAERLLEAFERGMWDASEGSLATLRQAVLEGEGWEEDR